MTEPEINHRAEARQEAEYLRESLIAGLAASASDLSSVARDLYKSAVLSRVERTVISVAIVLLLVSTLIGSILLVRISTIQTSNRASVETIEDCTRPTGKCFKEGQARTAAAVNNINKIVVAAAACARQHENDTEDEIRTCVQDSLRK